MTTHFVSFSGGRTSAYMVYILNKRRIKENLNMMFTYYDTGGEHPKTYEFIKRLVKEWDIPLICLKSVVNEEMGVGTSWEIIDVNDLKFDLTLVKKLMSKYGNFTKNRPYCTDKMKTRVADKFKKQMFGNNQDVYTWLGIRVDEPKRLKPKPNIKYLADISDFEKQDIINWWAQQSFDLEIPEHLGNCVFCVKKNIKKLALVERDEPELFNQFNEVVNDSKSVRLMEADKYGIGHVYRGWLSPNQLIAQFKDISTDDLRKQIYKSKEFDSNSCSESCEMGIN